MSNAPIDLSSWTRAARRRLGTTVSIGLPATRRPRHHPWAAGLARRRWQEHLAIYPDRVDVYGQSVVPPGPGGRHIGRFRRTIPLHDVSLTQTGAAPTYFLGLELRIGQSSWYTRADFEHPLRVELQQLNIYP